MGNSMTREMTFGFTDYLISLGISHHHWPNSHYFIDYSEVLGSEIDINVTY